MLAPCLINSCMQFVWRSRTCTASIRERGFVRFYTIFQTYSYIYIFINLLTDMYYKISNNFYVKRLLILQNFLLHVDWYIIIHQTAATTFINSKMCGYIFKFISSGYYLFLPKSLTKPINALNRIYGYNRKALGICALSLRICPCYRRVNFSFAIRHPTVR